MAGLVLVWTLWRNGLMKRCGPCTDAETLEVSRDACLRCCHHLRASVAIGWRIGCWLLQGIRDILMMMTDDAAAAAAAGAALMGLFGST